MEQILVLIVFSLTLAACTPDTGKFFDYDAIAYYATDNDGRELRDPVPDKSVSLLDSLKGGVLLGDIPGNIADTFFVGKLEQIAYKRRRISPSMFSAVDKIFTVKKESPVETTTCIHVYRDILVFRKNGWITGIAKICLGCNAYQIRGAQTSTAGFGSANDYEQLEQLFQKQEEAFLLSDR